MSLFYRFFLVVLFVVDEITAGMGSRHGCYLLAVTCPIGALHSKQLRLRLFALMVTAAQCEHSTIEINDTHLLACVSV